MKSIVSKLFGNSSSGSGSANSTITASTSTGSIHSLADATLTGKPSESIVPSQAAEHERQAKSSAGSTLDPMIGGPQDSAAKPAYRILDDSFANTTVYNPDASFIPRRSFEDDSVALSSVPIWPPRPGVVLISPLHQPSVQQPADLASPSGKRRLHDDEGAEEEEESQIPGYYPSIRMLPKSSTGLVPPEASARKIANPPKRYNVNPSKPPRFDLEAPALPSFAGVMASMEIAEPVASRTATESEVKLTPGPSKELVSPKPASAAFTFGSPAQRPHVFETPVSPAKLDDAVSKQLEEMQRRLGVENGLKPSASTSGNLSGILKAGVEGKSYSTLSANGMSRTVSTAQMAASVRFDESHDKHFSRSERFQVLE